MDKRVYRVSFGLLLLRLVLKYLARLVFSILGRIKVTGQENIPSGQPYVVAINHISIFDPPFAMAFWPTVIEAVGASDVFEKPFQGQLLQMYKVVPVHRGEYDRELIDIMLSMLRSGYPLLDRAGGRTFPCHGHAARQARHRIYSQRSASTGRTGWYRWYHRRLYEKRFYASPPYP